MKRQNGFLIALVLCFISTLALAASNFPGSLDSYSTKSSGDTIAEGHINDPQDAIEAIEAKVGTGASTPADTMALIGTGAGTSAWGDVPVDAGGTGSGTASGARTNLGLVIGTNVAAPGANTDITSLTGLTSAGDLCKVVTYEGDGSGSSTTAHGLGRTPIIVIAGPDPADEPYSWWIWVTGMTATYSSKTADGVASTTSITGVDGTNVTTGSTLDNNGKTYLIWCM